MSLDAKPQAPPSRSEANRDLLWGVWVMTAAFGSYFCMYAFRKPFTAASFSDTTLWGLGFKTLLVTSQVAGYMISKFIGIKVVAEMPRERRAVSILWLILIAEAALVLFGLTPRPWNAIFLFVNGLPLGIVFGLVLGSLEGRRLTEALTAGLCASFILADGVMKSVGAWLLNVGLPEDWMPSVAGAVFLLPLGICVAMLMRIPPPSRRDVAARAERFTMNRDERRAFLRRHAVGLFPLVFLYLVVTILRSIRADFAPEIWSGLKTSIDAATYTYSEVFIALGVLLVNGCAVLIHDNRRAFFAALATCGMGFALLAVALIAQRGGMLGGFSFMVLIGLGLYVPYVAFHTTVFERLLAMTRDRGTIAFLMSFADAIGYLGYVAVMVIRNVSQPTDDLLGLLTGACWLAVGTSVVCLLLSGWYFASLTRMDGEMAPARGDV